MHLQHRDDKGDARPATGASIAAVLREDHERLERWFQSIVADAGGGDHDRLRPTWRAFENEHGAHLDAEELHIFPGFATNYPNDARTLLTEHLEIRSKLLALGIDLDLHCLRAERVQSFVNELRTHAQREEQLLDPWAQERLGQAQAQKVRDTLVATKDSAGTRPVQDEWQIDAEQSTLRFSLRHIVIHEIAGRFTRWGGTLWMDSKDKMRSRLTVWVDLESIDTGDAERDQHVRSAEFFDVKHFPQARFVSRAVRMAGPRAGDVQGRLRLHGIDAAVDLRVVADDEDDLIDGQRVFKVIGWIDRQRFGLHWNQDLDRGGIVVGDQIAIQGRVAIRRTARS